MCEFLVPIRIITDCRPQKGQDAPSVTHTTDASVQVAQGLRAWGVVAFLTEDKLNRHRLVWDDSHGGRRESWRSLGGLQSPSAGWSGESHTVMNWVWVWLLEHCLLPVEQWLVVGKRHPLTLPPEGYPSRKHSWPVTSFTHPSP